MPLLYVSNHNSVKKVLNSVSDFVKRFLALRYDKVVFIVWVFITSFIKASSSFLSFLVLSSLTLASYQKFKCVQCQLIIPKYLYIVIIKISYLFKSWNTPNIFIYMEESIRGTISHWSTSSLTSFYVVLNFNNGCF